MLIDESMSGWRHKTTKPGGLPNYTFESCKPAPLGTMFQNGIEYISGVLVVVIQNPELQTQKAYHGDLSLLPDKFTITAHTAEVLWLVKKSGIPKGGWVGGNSWFGSVAMAFDVT
jgi:hypothetical protein